MPNRNRSWPYRDGQAASPPAITVSPDANLRSNLSLAGPSRLGTAPGVGPKGAPDAAYLVSDLGVDRVSPRGNVDYMGQGPKRWEEPSELIARFARRNDRQRRGGGGA